jgi:outer membrane lipoprotein LolB
MRHTSLLKVLLLSYLLTAMSGYAAEPESDLVKQLEWVEKADPIGDARKAVDRGEFALLGVNGYTWTIPGIEDSKKFELRKNYGLKIIEGTSDVVQGEEHNRLQGLATEYAKKYNLYLLDHIKTK